MIIKFTKADILRQKVMEAGWQSFTISKIEGPTPNANKDGWNLVVTFTLIDNPNPDLNGKEIRRTFSSKAIGMMTPLIEAATEKKLDIEDFELDADGLIGKKIDGKVSVDIYQGNPNNKVEEYVAYRKAAGQAPGF